MARAPVPTWSFALTVARHAGRFLLVQGCRDPQYWYLPAGRVEPGETFSAAACRATLEESGIPIVLEGLLRVEHTPRPDGSARSRVCFLARPADGRPPKNQPDEHSLRAAWVSLAELGHYHLRSPEVRELLEYVARGGAVSPLSLLTLEGTSWPPPLEGRVDRALARLALRRLLHAAIWRGAHEALEQHLVAGHEVAEHAEKLDLLEGFADEVGAIVTRPDLPVEALEALLDGWAALPEPQEEQDILRAAAAMAYSQVALERSAWWGDEEAKLYRLATTTSPMLQEVLLLALERMRRVEPNRTLELLRRWRSDENVRIAALARRVQSAQ